MSREEPHDQGRHDEHVDHEQARDDVVARELAAEDEECQPRTEDRYRFQHRVRDPQPRTREEVVGEAVPREPVGEPEEQQAQPDRPVDLARTAERAGEEDAHQVGDDRGEEQQRSPMVDLPHHEAGANVEGHLERRLVGGRHVHAAQRRVAAVVHDVARIGNEEEREVHAGEDQDHQAVHGDLADHERPVVGEHLVERGASEPRGTEPLVEPRGDATRDHQRSRSQNPGPIGWS